MSSLIKKYGWIFIVSIVIIIVWNVVKLFLQKKGYVSGTDKYMMLDDIKKALQNNFFFRKKITENIDGNIKIKKDVEKDIQNIFDKYSRT